MWQSPSTDVRDLGIYLDWRHYAVSVITDCLTLLLCPETVMHYTVFSVAVCLSVSRHSFGSDEGWIWKRYAGPPAGGHECSGSNCHPDKSLWSYHSATPLPVLALCAAGHIFQACRRCIPVCPWTWTGLPVWRPSAGRKDSRSTTAAVIVDLSIGHPLYTTVHCRRPSVFRCRSTHMEQFASWSDITIFPANFQNHTKISFFWHLFHSF